MDRNSAPNYEEKSASQSVADTKEFIDYVRKELDPPPVLEGTRRPLTAESLVQPIITPRFAISCSDALLTSLAALVARDPTLPIQTHLAENPSEIEFTKSAYAIRLCCARSDELVQACFPLPTRTPPSTTISHY